MTGGLTQKNAEYTRNYSFLKPVEENMGGGEKY